ncbi:Putative protein of unknown function [Podospora comata]|uniref:Uncharacterized protein n=1 Tax=Podospora comata TaxID=48703 RepID=A0ABY6S8I2_PODCO|nr:Putative protein of unknown function [Podospora comata]
MTPSLYTHTLQLFHLHMSTLTPAHSPPLPISTPTPPSCRPRPTTPIPPQPPLASPTLPSLSNQLPPSQRQQATSPPPLRPSLNPLPPGLLAPHQPTLLLAGAPLSSGWLFWVPPSPLASVYKQLI